MIHTLILDGKSYDLPKKNISIANKLDEVLKVDAQKGLNVRQKFQKLHEFAKEVLGEEVAKEVLGTELLDDVDLSELTIVVRRIIDAYDKPVMDYQSERNRVQFSQLPIKQLEGLANVVNMASAMENKK